MKQKILSTSLLLLTCLVIGMVVFAFLQARQTAPVTPLSTFEEPTAPPPTNLSAPRLPLPGVVQVDTELQHTIPLEEIKRGCHKQDCIPAVSTPEFAAARTLSDVLAADSLGIRLDYKGESVFYPFPMLETHELVNDEVAGDPLLISYCPLCGTGIVFDRTVAGEALEFGVSGMLWQSNLLMYNRAPDMAQQNLWSQVLGAAVVGPQAGQVLTVVPSDIMPFATWLAQNPDGKTLVTGEPTNPYNGEYYTVAQNFAPDFDAATSVLPPMEYVYGIIVAGQPKAYPRSLLPAGETSDVINDVPITVQKTAAGVVTFTVAADAALVADVEGFWFSWQAAHPDTLLWGVE